MSENIIESAEFVADWSAAEDVPLQTVNQFISQVGLPESSGRPDGAFLTLGHVSPPVVFGDDALKREQLARYNGRLKIEPVARVFMTKARLYELMTVLGQTIAQLEEADAAGQQQVGPRHGF